MGVAEFNEAAELISKLAPKLMVQKCFLELSAPSIGEAIASLVSRGVRRVTAMPLLLLAAGHAKHDIPVAIEAAAACDPLLEVRLAPPLGCHELVLELSAQRFREALAARGDVPLEETCLLMVGRGSRDPAATAEMHRFSERRRLRTPVGHMRTCFVSMAEPLLEEVLAKTPSAGFRRVVVQPHLLFHGELAIRLCAMTEAVARKCPDQEWIVTEHLGPAWLLAEAAIQIQTECSRLIRTEN